MRKLCPNCETIQEHDEHTGNLKMTIDGKAVNEPYKYYRCRDCKGEWVNMLDNDDPMARAYKKHTGAKEVIFISEN